MINILEHDVPTTASVGSFGETESSNTRTDNPYKDPLSYLIASIRGSLTEEFPARKTALTHEVALALYEKALEILNLREVSKE